jgi:hypothetical protein
MGADGTTSGAMAAFTEAARLPAGRLLRAEEAVLALGEREQAGGLHEMRRVRALAVGT